MDNLLELDYIRNLEGTRLDKRFEIHVKDYVCARSLAGLDWSDATKCLLGNSRTLLSIYWTYGTYAWSVEESLLVVAVSALAVAATVKRLFRLPTQESRSSSAVITPLFCVPLGDFSPYFFTPFSEFNTRVATALVIKLV
jgi:hypothetical protein